GRIANRSQCASNVGCVALRLRASPQSLVQFTRKLPRTLVQLEIIQRLLEDKGKLIARDSSNQAGVDRTSTQMPAKKTKDSIAGLMAETVIHVPEALYIHDKQGWRRATLGDIVKRLAKRLFHASPIMELGQIVLIDLSLQLLGNEFQIV